MDEAFSAGSAAFDAFAKRGKSGVLAQAALGYVVGALLIGVAVAVLNWGAIINLAGAYGEVMGAAMKGVQISDPSDPRMQALMQGYLSLLPSYLLAIFLLFVLMAAFEAAVYRWLVRGEAGGGVLGLTLGADTWRVYLCYWMWLVLIVALYLAMLIVALVVGGVLGMAFGQNGAMATGAIVGLLVLALICVFIAIVVRFAPAAAVTVGRKRFAFFDAWNVSKGRAFSMFGAFLILSLLYFLAIIVFYGIMFAVLMGPMIGQMSAGAPPDPAMMLSAFSPAAIAILALGYLAVLVVAMMIMIGFMGVNAKAARMAIAEGRVTGPAS